MITDMLTPHCMEVLLAHVRAGLSEIASDAIGEEASTGVKMEVDL